MTLGPLQKAALFIGVFPVDPRRVCQLVLLIFHFSNGHLLRSFG